MFLCLLSGTFNFQRVSIPGRKLAELVASLVANFVSKNVKLLFCRYYEQIKFFDECTL